MKQLEKYRTIHSEYSYRCNEKRVDSCVEQFKKKIMEGPYLYMLCM